MKLEKITERPARRYEDACGTAHALDLVGERWALLVMRELLLGPRRFGELRASLPGLSANVLTQRLEGLEAAGALRRRHLPPPASVQVYELTAWGMEIEPVILALGRWGARSPMQDITMPLSAVGMMLSFRAMFDPVLATGVAVTAGFRIGRESYGIRIVDSMLTGDRGMPERGDVELSGAPAAIAGAVYGLVDVAAAEKSGAISLRGDRGAFVRFSACFVLPEKATTAAASTFD